MMYRPALLYLVLCVSACATAPDPADVCTARWIDARADKAVAALSEDTDRVIRNLRKTGQTYLEGDTPGVLSMFSLRRSIEKLEDELTDGRGVRDLRTLASTCNDPTLVADALSGWLDGLGLPDMVAQLIAATDIWQEALRGDG